MTGITEFYDKLETQSIGPVNTSFVAQSYVWRCINIVHRLNLWKTTMVYFSSFIDFDLICWEYASGLFSEDSQDS